MRTLRALRALARVELREIRRHAGRSWLVVLLVAVPVAAMVGASALFRTTQRTPEEQRSARMGRAALWVELGEGRIGDDARALLPADARIVGVWIDRADVRVPGRKLAARAIALDAAELEAQGLAHGMLRIVEGRAPARGDEVALSPVLLAGLAREVGDEVTLASGPMRVTGVVLDPENLDLPVVLRTADPEAPSGAHAWLVDLPPAACESAAARLRAAGHRVIARTGVGERDEFESLALFVIGGFGFFEAALVISAAFAVGLRRRQREIGLLAATGASRADLRTALIASVIAFASAGALVGVGVGIAAAAALHPFLDGWNRRWNGELELSWEHVIGALILGLCAAVAAAALPARSATRLPIRVALSGRRPVSRGSRAWLAIGLALDLGGIALTLWGARSSGGAAGVAILGGSILGVLGLGACSSWLLGALARFALPLPVVWRLAVRDAGRFRTRNGPVVTAVLAGMSVSVMLSALAGSIEALLRRSPATLRDDQLVIDGPGAEEVARRIASELPCAAIAPLAAAYSQGELVTARLDDPKRERAGDAWIAVGEEELLTALDAGAALADLRAARVVALVESARTANAESVELVARSERRVALAPAATCETTQRVRAPRFVIGTHALAALGLEARPPPGASPSPWLVRLESAVTEDFLERAQTCAAGVAGTAVSAALLERAPANLFIRFVLLISLVTGWIVVSIATALSSVESAADARVLHTVGASPSTLRMHVAARAGYLALLGCVLAVPAGLVPSYGLIALANVTLEFAIPWSEVLVVVLGLPALAFAGAWLFAALHCPARAARPIAP